MLLNRITSRSTHDDDEKEFVLSGMCTSSITMKSSSSVAVAEAEAAALVLIKEDTAVTMNPKQAICQRCRMIVDGIMDISGKMRKEPLSHS